MLSDIIVAYAFAAVAFATFAVLFYHRYKDCKMARVTKPVVSNWNTVCGGFSIVASMVCTSLAGYCISIVLYGVSVL